jgi:hypothetical protein
MAKNPAIKNRRLPRIRGDIYPPKTAVILAVSFGGIPRTLAELKKSKANLRRFCKPMQFQKCLDCGQRIACFINGKKCLTEGD